MLTQSAMLNALPGDKAAIRRYVTGEATTNLAEGSIAVNVTHSNLRQLVQELRFGSSFFNCRVPLPFPPFICFYYYLNTSPIPLQIFTLRLVM
jgi:hypothetical protein